MSYCIVHMQKFNINAVKGIEIHNEREKESLSNPDIQKELSGENYSLKKSDSYLQDIKQNIADLDLKKAVRKDAVVMCGFVVTSDSSFFENLSEEKEKEFFKKSYDFIAERYGEKNVINAVVHKDEKTPHLHIAITPIRDGKLSAKNIFNKKELTQLQTDFYKEVGREFGLERGESREEKRKHLDTQEYKLKTKVEQIERVEKIINENDNRIHPNDVKRKSAKLGLVKESDEELAARLSKSYVTPVALKSKKLEEKNQILEKEKKQEEAKNQRLKKENEALKIYKSVFEGLSQEQMKKIVEFSENCKQLNKKDQDKKQEVTRNKKDKSQEMEL